MHQNNLLPLALLIGGALGALYFAYVALGLFLSGNLAGQEPVMGFAIASVLACIGWQEMRSTDLFNESE